LTRWTCAFPAVAEDEQFVEEKGVIMKEISAME
jgi:hypothetical protein